MAATTTTVNDDIREALMGILDAQDGHICPGCGRVYFHLDDALSDDDDAQWDVDMHDDGCQVVEGIAAIKAYREQQNVTPLTATMVATIEELRAGLREALALADAPRQYGHQATSDRERLHDLADKETN